MWFQYKHFIIKIDFSLLIFVTQLRNMLYTQEPNVASNYEIYPLKLIILLQNITSEKRYVRSVLRTFTE